MKIELSPQDQKYFRQILREVCSSSRILESRSYMQHGTTSIFRHSVSVAYVSFWLAQKLDPGIDPKTLIRGALLHDYFLYDWHVADASHRLHGFFHAKKALINALQDFDLNEVEQNMIKRHMFPLNPIPPKYKEAWILCCADKICSGSETVDGMKRKLSGITHKTSHTD